MSTLLAILFLRSASIAAAQGIPKINIAPSCRAAAKGTAGLTQEFDSCRGSEKAARDTLDKQWKNFRAADLDSCYQLTTPGTPGTYMEPLATPGGARLRAHRSGTMKVRKILYVIKMRAASLSSQALRISVRRSRKIQNRNRKND